MPKTFEQSQAEIARLVKYFSTNRAMFRAPGAKEAHARQELIDPLFLALGWDVHNDEHTAPQYRDVVFEDSLEIEGALKAPDYAFRVGKEIKFYTEAKKPTVPIETDADPAYQLRRYGWNGKLPLSLLTNFETLAVYNCRIRPRERDKATVARVQLYTFEQYPDRWRELWDIYSKPAVLGGSFDQFVQTGLSKRGVSPVDSEFLQDIEQWRLLLARNMAIRNLGLSTDDLNDAVQRTIDRIIFLRIAEDRGIEAYERLLKLTRRENIYGELVRLFRLADQKYNSGLFDYSRGSGDKLTPTLKVDDAPLTEIITNLYAPQSPYKFDIMPAEILGNVYEQFLGKVIHLTPTHQARVEDKPEVRKAGGVYYTPAYIVAYIVKQTVGQAIDNLLLRRGEAFAAQPANSKLLAANVSPLPPTAQPANSKKRPANVSPLPDNFRVLDMACGSGSFLLGAYQFLLDYYLKYYTEHEPAKFKQAVRQERDEWRLTTAERKRILTTHIFGVDIDRQAVEVTKLSLLLKVLEGESDETLQPTLEGLHERALPNLDQNIKCGNSLIGPDYFSGQMFPDADELKRVNPFDWEREFPEAMKAGGFDCVIGNPPYVRQETLIDLKDYLQEHYTVFHPMADLYSYFVERGVYLLRPDGKFGFIVANKWIRTKYGEPLRHWLKAQCIEEVVDFGDLPVFQTVSTYPCILRLAKNPPHPTLSITQVQVLDFVSLENYIQDHSYSIYQSSLDDNGWILADEREQQLTAKLRTSGIHLSEYVKGQVYNGIKTGLNEAFVIDAKTKKELIDKDPKSEEVIKPFLIGRDVKRYYAPENELFLIFFPRGWTRTQLGNAKDAWRWLQEKYPAVATYLAPYSIAANKRNDKGEYWWELRACDYYAEFEKSKIIYPNICKRPEFAFDNAGVFANQKCFIIPIDDKYLLGLLNSSITFFLFRHILPKLRGDFYEPSYIYLKLFPVRPINFSDPADKARHDRMVALVEQMLKLHKRLHAATSQADRDLYQRQIESTDAQIDALVYQLYALTPQEIAIVEASAA